MAMSNSYDQIDPYLALEVGHEASQEEIKRAYLKLVRLHHPDKNPGDQQAELRFLEIQTAYELIGKLESRREYDLRYHSPFGEANRQPEVSNIFKTSDRSRKRPPMRGRDLETIVELDFDEALNGTTAEAIVNIESRCLVCKNDHSQTFACRQCLGEGVLGEGTDLQICSFCEGKGNVSCNSCGGSGRTIELRKHKIKIPPGVETGTRIRVSGKGSPGIAGGTPGDLHVIIQVGDNSLFERQGANLIINVPLRYAEAILGVIVMLPTPDGPISLKIPAFSEDGKLLRIRGRGAPKLGGGGRGDLQARIKITMPKTITADERDLLETLLDISSEDPRPHFYKEEETEPSE